MSAPLSASGYEVLRALVLGIQVNAIDVGDVELGRLRDSSYVVGDNTLAITESSRLALRTCSEMWIREAFAWVLNGTDSTTAHSA
jgi:hypothetical protein